MLPSAGTQLVKIKSDVNSQKLTFQKDSSRAKKGVKFIFPKLQEENIQLLVFSKVA